MAARNDLGGNRAFAWRVSAMVGVALLCTILVAVFSHDPQSKSLLEDFMDTPDDSQRLIEHLRQAGITSDSTPRVDELSRVVGDWILAEGFVDQVDGDVPMDGEDSGWEDERREIREYLSRWPEPIKTVEDICTAYNAYLLYGGTREFYWEVENHNETEDDE